MLDTPTQYCERLAHTGWEPFNVLSSAAYLVSAILIFYFLYQQRNILRYTLSALVAFIGFGSIWWHIGHSPYGNLADTLSIIIFASVVGILLLRKLLRDKILIFISFFCLFGLALWADQYNYLNGSLPYIVLLIGLIVAGILHIRNFPRSRKLIFSAILTFSVAIILRSMDLEICAFFRAGTHFLWHILVSILVYQLALLVNKTESKPIPR